MHNKGDAMAPKIRCRYVATEVNHGNDLAYYASTPPLESIRLLVGQMAQRKSRGGKPLVLSFRMQRKHTLMRSQPGTCLFVHRKNWGFLQAPLATSHDAPMAPAMPAHCGRSTMPMFFWGWDSKEDAPDLLASITLSGMCP